MSLANLLAEMTAHQEEELAKAAPLPDDPDGDEDDEAIQAAAENANADNADQELGGEDEDGEQETEAGAADDKPPMTKSFSFQMEDGEQVEAFDATELIKSMGADMAALRDESVNVMTQAFTMIKSQAAEIARLKTQVSALGSTGRGRKTVVTVTEKVAVGTLAKSSNVEAPSGFSRDEFFAKAATAQRAGRVSAADISVAEAYTWRQLMPMMRFNLHPTVSAVVPWAQLLFGYPVVGSEGKLSASFDGLTMDRSVAFEHKTLSQKLRAAMVDGCTGAELPMVYRLQMEQQCMVSGAGRVLFLASKWDEEGRLIEERHCWYEPNLELRARIVAGWAQFERDLADYKPPLPSLSIDE